MACIFCESQHHRKLVIYCQETTGKRGTNFGKHRENSVLSNCVWDQLPSDLVIKLHDSLSGRLHDVLKSKGAVIGC